MREASHYYLFVGGPLNFSWHQGSVYLEKRKQTFYRDYIEERFGHTTIFLYKGVEMTLSLKEAVVQALDRGPEHDD